VVRLPGPRIIANEWCLLAFELREVPMTGERFTPRAEVANPITTVSQSARISLEHVSNATRCQIGVMPSRACGGEILRNLIWSEKWPHESQAFEVPEAQNGASSFKI
jgi:hypothetical protein